MASGLRPEMPFKLHNNKHGCILGSSLAPRQAVGLLCWDAVPGHSKLSSILGCPRSNPASD